MTSKTPAQQWADKKKRLAGLKPALSKLTICDDQSLRIQLADAVAELDDAEEALRGLAKDDDDFPASHVRAETARTALADAQSAFDDQAVTLMFRALNLDELKALQDAHPPTEEEEAEGSTFAETFMPELIAAASLDGMPAEDAQHYLNTWPPGDSRDLWAAAWGVQHSKRTDVGKG